MIHMISFSMPLILHKCNKFVWLFVLSNKKELLFIKEPKQISKSKARRQKYVPYINRVVNGFNAL